MINILADNALLLGYSKGESKISPAMIKSCYQDLRLGASEEKTSAGKKGAGQEARPGGGVFRPWWKWAAAVLLIAGILAFVAIRYGDRILSGFVTASVEPPKTRVEMVQARGAGGRKRPGKSSSHSGSSVGSREGKRAAAGRCEEAGTGKRRKRSSRRRKAWPG